MQPAYRYRATARRVIDGDTLVLDVDLGFRVYKTIAARLRGVDTPEEGQPGFIEASDFVRGLVVDQPLIISSYKDRKTFDRWVCDVWIVNSHQALHLADTIIAHGYGQPA